MREKNKIKLLSFVGAKCASFLSCLGKKSWILTIVFFLASFLFSVFVWYQNVFRVAPDGEIVSGFVKKESELEDKIKKIDKAIQHIEERKDIFEKEVGVERERIFFIKNEKIFSRNSSDKNIGKSKIDSAQ